MHPVTPMLCGDKVLGWAELSRITSQCFECLGLATCAVVSMHAFLRSRISCKEALSHTGHKCSTSSVFLKKSNAPHKFNFLKGKRCIQS